jgi:hypothetical protein
MRFCFISLIISLFCIAASCQTVKSSNQDFKKTLKQNQLSCKTATDCVVKHLTTGNAACDAEDLEDLLPPDSIKIVIELSIIKLGYLNPWLFYFVSKCKQVPLNHTNELLVLCQAEKDSCIGVLWRIMFDYFNNKEKRKNDNCSNFSCSVLKPFLKSRYSSKDIKLIYEEYSGVFGL